MKQRAINPRMAALAERVAGRIVRTQTRLAERLNRKTQHWNRTSKLIALALFILVFGGLSTWVLIHSL